MVQIGLAFFAFGFSMAKIYKEVRKCVKGGADGDIDPETGQKRPVTCYLCFEKVAVAEWDNTNGGGGGIGHRKHCAESEKGKRKGKMRQSANTWDSKQPGFLWKNVL
jgi:hypothetical protein